MAVSYGSRELDRTEIVNCCAQQTWRSVLTRVRSEGRLDSANGDAAYDPACRYAWYAGILAAALYLAQLFTPFRLTSDAIDYLSLADSAFRGSGLNTLFSASFRFPKGYAVFAFLLMKSGLFSSATMIAANLVFFAVGLALAFRTLIALGFQRNPVLIACLLTLLSFTAVKHITQGMSDFLFFAAASCVCWLITVRNAYRWAAMVAAAVCAVETRFIGIALLAPLLVAAWPQIRKRRIVLSVLGTVTLLLLAVGLWAGRHYLLGNIVLLRGYGLSQFVARTVQAHSQDFAELIFNMPFSKLPASSGVLLLPAGSVALLLFVTGTFVMRTRAPWLFAYLIAYTALVLPWPFTDPRFWLPVMPFVFLAIGEGIAFVSGRAPKPALVAPYAVAFCLLGFVALSYSTWLTFSGAKFPDRYGDGLLRTTYVANCSAASPEANERALELLRHYAWRCQ